MITANMLKRIGSLGGPIKVRKDLAWVYSGGPNFTKEKLFGIHGPLFPGMPSRYQMAIEATQSDSKQTLIRELVEQGGLSRKVAEDTVQELIRKGILQEVKSKDLGKVIIFRGR